MILLGGAESLHATLGLTLTETCIPKVGQVDMNLDWVALGSALYGEPYGSMGDAENWSCELCTLCANDTLRLHC